MITTPRELLQAQAIAALPRQASTGSLNPNAHSLSQSLGDATGLTQLGVHLVSVMPGHDSSEYHRHLYEEECVYVLSGQGVALIDGESHVIGPGDFLGFPRGGVAHMLTNSGTEPLL